MRVVSFQQYGGAEVLGVEEVPAPEPGPGQVRVRVHAATVTQADIEFRRGTSLAVRLFAGLYRPGQPVLGSELAGVIDAVGAGVTRFAVGDRVYAATGDDFGAHAEQVCLPEDGAIARMPAGLGFAEAAGVCESALTALPFLRDHGKVQPGQRVLINGASGAVGSAAVQLAKHLGAHVTAVCSARNVGLVRSLGADVVLDYGVTDFLEGSDRYDVVFDVVGKAGFTRSKRVLVEGGRYLSPVLGARVMLDMELSRFFGSKKAILAFTGLRGPVEKAADLTYVAGLVEAGALRAVVEHTFAPEQAAEAHRLAESGHKRGNAVLCFA